jgi:3-oxoisoapionate decarboxylase
VPFKELFALLAEHNDTMIAAIEIGALEARHVRLFTPGWWHGYAPKQAEELAACLLAAQRNRLPEGAEWRTPWERNADHELVEYELRQVRRSAENMKALGFM